jgi:hypothetical protein
VAVAVVAGAARRRLPGQVAQVLGQLGVRVSIEECRSVITESCRSAGVGGWWSRVMGEEPRRGDEPVARGRAG